MTKINNLELEIIQLDWALRNFLAALESQKKIQSLDCTAEPDKDDYLINASKILNDYRAEFMKVSFKLIEEIKNEKN